MSPDINAATLAAARNGIVRSVEIMAPTPAFAEAAAELLRLRATEPAIDVGVHLTLTSEFDTYRWHPLLPKHQVPSLYDAEGFCPVDVETLRAQAKVEHIRREL